MGRRLDLEVAHAVLHVCDAEAMVDFYTRVLDFEVTDRGPLGSASGEEIIFLSQTADHHHQLALITGRDSPGRSNNLNHVAFRSSGTLDDLRALKVDLEAEPGIGNIRPLTHGNAWSVYFTDPEGNGVEVFIDTPWHVAQPQGKPLGRPKRSRRGPRRPSGTSRSSGRSRSSTPAEPSTSPTAAAERRPSCRSGARREAGSGHADVAAELAAGRLAGEP